MHRLDIVYRYLDPDKESWWGGSLIKTRKIESKSPDVEQVCNSPDKDKDLRLDRLDGSGWR